jgi:HSP90 family molecular chaperone
LHVIDDGIGFSHDAIERVGVLGAGVKQNVPYSKSSRHYLGSYGYGLKSSLNVADKVRICSVSDEGNFSGNLDWAKLDEALRPDFEGFDFRQERAKPKQATGTHITLHLKNPTSKDQLQQFQ